MFKSSPLSLSVVLFCSNSLPVPSSCSSYWFLVVFFWFVFCLLLLFLGFLILWVLPSCFYMRMILIFSLLLFFVKSLSAFLYLCLSPPWVHPTVWILWNLKGGWRMGQRGTHYILEPILITGWIHIFFFTLVKCQTS